MNAIARLVALLVTFVAGLTVSTTAHASIAAATSSARSTYSHDTAFHPLESTSAAGVVSADAEASATASDVPSAGNLSAFQALFVAADTATGAVPRFITNAAGDTLDTTRITIPEGKFGYLLKGSSKSGVFSDSMGFDQSSLDSALRSHLVDNFGRASESAPMTGGGMRFTVRGPMTGPSGQTWNITTAWGVDPNGTIRLITATP